MKSRQNFYTSLSNPEFAPTAFRVALIVGTILFAINHGSALLRGTMNRDRWLSGMLTYMVPYMVNIHGQHTSRYK